MFSNYPLGSWIFLFENIREVKIIKNERQRVSVTQASIELGMNPQGVREYMKRGLIDIGIVVPNMTGSGYRYIIMRNKLNKVLGIENEKE